MHLYSYLRVFEVICVLVGCKGSFQASIRRLLQGQSLATYLGNSHTVGKETSSIYIHIKPIAFFEFFGQNGWSSVLYPNILQDIKKRNICTRCWFGFATQLHEASERMKTIASPVIRVLRARLSNTKSDARVVKKTVIVSFSDEWSNEMGSKILTQYYRKGKESPRTRKATC